MGGNTKIALELARNLPNFDLEVVVIVPEAKLPTFTSNIGTPRGVVYHLIPNFVGSEFLHPISSVRHYYRHAFAAFSTLGVNSNDLVFVTCNFHFEIVPLVLLKRRFHFIYVPSHFLFSPFIFENIVHRYRLPPLKWLCVWFYERLFFEIAKTSANGFVITNESDCRHFPQRFQGKILAIYGGVNVEQIAEAFDMPDLPVRYDAVFCSRLHPQKGVAGLLDIWRRVVDYLPKARLAIIGNGAHDYEASLRNKAERLDLSGNIDWLGYVNNVEKYRVYRASKMLLHTTVYDNNGMVAAEALCSGLPVVMFDLPMLRDLYTDGCVKVPEGDRAAFAEAIVSLLQNASRFDAVRPTSAQIDALRERWNWWKRTELFVEFVTGMAMGGRR